MFSCNESISNCWFSDDLKPELDREIHVNIIFLTEKKIKFGVTPGQKVEGKKKKKIMSFSREVVKTERLTPNKREYNHISDPKI